MNILKIKAMENNKYLKGNTLAGFSNKNDRVDLDFYATPPYAVDNMLSRLKQDEVGVYGSILEPCCGAGHISDVLIEHFGKENVYSYDIVNRGYKMMNGVADFVNDKFDIYDNVITNPPFKLAKEFIEKSLSITNDKVIMLCKIQLLEGVSRVDMFRNTPLKYVYVNSKRVATYKNGMDRDFNGKKWATTMCLAWFIWEHGYSGEPLIRWI